MPIWTQGMQRTWWPEAGTIIVTGPYSFRTWHLALWVSLLTPKRFHFPSLIFGPLVAKYLVENRVSGTLWKNYWFHSKFSWIIPTCVAHDCKVEIFIAYFWMHKVGSDQSGGISPWITISVSSGSPQGHWIYSEKKHRTLVVLEWIICEQQCCWLPYIL